MKDQRLLREKGNKGHKEYEKIVIKDVHVELPGGEKSTRIAMKAWMTSMIKTMSIRATLA
jgi:hypothetical protein